MVGVIGVCLGENHSVLRFEEILEGVTDGSESGASEIEPPSGGDLIVAPVGLASGVVAPEITTAVLKNCITELVAVHTIAKMALRLLCISIKTTAGSYYAYRRWR